MSDSKKPAEGVSYTRPTSQLDLEERLKRDNEVAPIMRGINPVDQGEDDEDGFVGTDPIYQNFAEDDGKPLAAEKGPEAEAEQLFDDAVAGKPGKETEATKAVNANAAVQRREDPAPAVTSDSTQSSSTSTPATSGDKPASSTPAK